ncbi:MAG: RNA-processing protein [Candidatus Heimdallarchaeota archaeon]|nr:RNA-processing protein [Candidatus Heimdallarchaeota archaeon]
MSDPMPEEDISRFYITIPQDRIGALIGPDGSVKNRLEREAGVEIDIDSNTGDVIVRSTSETEDPFLVIKARDFVTAVGRGFNPQVAFTLLQDDTYLEIINLKLAVGDNPRKLNRIRGRIIGRGGRTRKVIEETTGTRVTIYGKTVGIIGTYERLKVAREALYLLIDGAKHGTVYRFLEEEARILKMRAKSIWKKPPEELQ